MSQMVHIMTPRYQHVPYYDMKMPSNISQHTVACSLIFCLPTQQLLSQKSLPLLLTYSLVIHWTMLYRVRRALWWEVNTGAEGGKSTGHSSNRSRGQWFHASYSNDVVAQGLRMWAGRFQLCPLMCMWKGGGFVIFLLLYLSLGQSLSSM